jgi:hypothetical protein
VKKLLVLLLCFFSLNVSCFRQIKPPEVQEISDELLENLSKDLAEIQIMVENAQGKYKQEEMQVKVIEPWTESFGLKLGLQTPSGRKEFDVIRKSKIQVPMLKGWATADVFKLAEGKSRFIAVGRSDFWGKMVMSVPKESMVAGHQVKFYDPQLGADQKSVDAVTKYVSLTYKLEDTARKILEKLKDLQKKYKESPIYIEGFNIQFPLISVTVLFKFK